MHKPRNVRYVIYLIIIYLIILLLFYVNALLEENEKTKKP